ncbi:hypothetical protein BMS3Abin10_02367 [bacterium BMS3Abin10]|nr:hypothetical protein BMS3Abin10_02367 [bacterium BMS3Abin10]GBE39703.1 hypothetical protein BMS3Bbin08_02334 [bacterium BMS3Bbin08]
MSKAVLKKGAKNYSGKYVAIRSFKNTEVLSSGSDPSKVLSIAKGKGAKDPVIFYVPKKGAVHIY